MVSRPWSFFKGPDTLGNFCVFCEKICHHFRDTSAPGEFFSHQILSSITKLHRRRCPALEQDKFLSGVKTVQILQFARHDLKKKFLSAPTIIKWKIWQRQILSRFLDGPNKFCQSLSCWNFRITVTMTKLCTKITSHGQ